MTDYPHSRSCRCRRRTGQLTRAAQHRSHRVHSPITRPEPDGGPETAPDAGLGEPKPAAAPPRKTVKTYTGISPDRDVFDRSRGQPLPTEKLPSLGRKWHGEADDHVTGRRPGNGRLPQGVTNTVGGGGGGGGGGEGAESSAAVR